MKNSDLTELQNRCMDREKTIFSDYACFSKNAVRLTPEESKASLYRSPFCRDSDTIMQTNTYARYMDKTQVFYLFANQHITHRSLHVQFVSSIARTIGRLLQLNEDLIEAIALGHDLGHPAFGHEGEGILNTIASNRGIGAFAHNAQSVRTLLELENNGWGVSVTLQVLDGILSHNGELLQERYIPLYSKTSSQFENELKQSIHDAQFSKGLYPMTLEGCVVRIADIMAYIGRDIEDAIRLNVIDRASIPSEISRVLGESNRQIIDTLVDDLVSCSYGKEYLALTPAVFDALQQLKDFNYRTIYYNPRIKVESKKIERMFHLLFDLYYESLVQGDEESDIFLYFLKDRKSSYMEKNEPARIVIDFMASMTDSFIINQFNKLYFPKNFGYFIPSE
ncbi:MAG: HD domain-containing protein [Spirochaetes bacterium]|jgi:dGTPase|nr:HD domain-containing protein [Spirochaetota bacterium]